MDEMVRDGYDSGRRTRIPPPAKPRRTVALVASMGLILTLTTVDVQASGGTRSRDLRKRPGLVFSGAYDVGPAGDFNGDGRQDWLAASDPGVHPAGAVFVVLEEPTTREATFDEGAGYGVRINGSSNDAVLLSGSSAGDVNGDGMDDLVLEAPTADNNRRGDSGTAYVVFGTESRAPIDLHDFDLGLQGSRGFRIDGAASGDFAGQSASGVRDLDGDGLDEVVVGAAFRGATYVVAGKSDNLPVDLLAYELGANEKGFRVDHPLPEYAAFLSVRGIGDFNGDGQEDFAIGLLRNLKRRGRVYVIYGTSSTEDVDVRDLRRGQGLMIRGARPGDEFGHDLAPAGRFDKDRFDDLIVGAPGTTHLGGRGKAFVIFGAAGLPSVRASRLGSRGVIIHGPRGKSDFGSDVSGAGDTNADGRTDVLIGAPMHSPLGRDYAGSAWLVHAPRRRTHRIVADGAGGSQVAFHGRFSGDHAGYSVSAFGGGNGDPAGVLVSAVSACERKGCVHHLRVAE